MLVLGFSIVRWCRNPSVLYTVTSNPPSRTRASWLSVGLLSTLVPNSLTRSTAVRAAPNHHFYHTCCTLVGPSLSGFAFAHIYRVRPCIVQGQIPWPCHAQGGRRHRQGEAWDRNELVRLRERSQTRPEICIHVMFFLCVPRKTAPCYGGVCI